MGDAVAWVRAFVGDVVKHDTTPPECIHGERAYCIRCSEWTGDGRVHHDRKPLKYEPLSPMSSLTRVPRPRRRS